MNSKIKLTKHSMRAKIAFTNFLHGKFYWMNTRIVMKSKVEIEKSRLKVQKSLFSN